MGKAKILSELGDGQYKIQVLESRERAESAKDQAESRITENRTAITQLESDIQAAQAEVDRLAGEQSDAIDRFQSGESDLEISDLSEYAKAVAKAAEARDKIRIEKKTKERMIEADQSLIGKVNALPPLREIQAWCADYTDDLSGEVATAEVPGEIGQVIIKPGFEGANQWSPQADGMIQPALSSTAAGTFYNLAMLPGQQKWRPAFRTATLTSVDTDNDTGSISLDSATSSQQGLGVNYQTSFSDVPIEYMECNGGAFEAGDKVLVSFAGGAKSPAVIGFESEPKPCEMDYVVIYNRANDNNFMSTGTNSHEFGRNRTEESRDGNRVTVTGLAFKAQSDPRPIMRQYDNIMPCAVSSSVNTSGATDLGGNRIDDPGGILDGVNLRVNNVMPGGSLEIIDDYSGSRWYENNFTGGPIIDSGGEIKGNAIGKITPATSTKSTTSIRFANGESIEVSRDSGFTGNYTMTGKEGPDESFSGYTITFSSGGINNALEQNGLDVWPYSGTFDRVDIGGIDVDLQSIAVYNVPGMLGQNYHTNYGNYVGSVEQRAPDTYTFKTVCYKKGGAGVRAIFGFKVYSRERGFFGETLYYVLIGFESGPVDSWLFEPSYEEESDFKTKTGASRTVIAPFNQLVP